jgi:hypothetical protein
LIVDKYFACPCRFSQFINRITDGFDKLFRKSVHIETELCFRQDNRVSSELYCRWNASNRCPANEECDRKRINECVCCGTHMSSTAVGCFQINSLHLIHCGRTVLLKLMLGSITKSRNSRRSTPDLLKLESSNFLTEWWFATSYAGNVRIWFLGKSGDMMSTSSHTIFNIRDGLSDRMMFSAADLTAGGFQPQNHFRPQHRKRYAELCGDTMDNYFPCIHLTRGCVVRR